jgi:hypothetical protein
MSAADFVQGAIAGLVALGLYHGTGAVVRRVRTTTTTDTDTDTDTADSSTALRALVDPPGHDQRPLRAGDRRNDPPDPPGQRRTLRAGDRHNDTPEST